MLSIENSPPDPSCPREISQLKSGSDERDSDKVALQVVDLLESGLDDNKNPLPKFSIRDYVFSARNKDINTNWPFSQENLQLCLEHGMKDLLPPFRNLDSARNRSTVETNLIGKESKLNEVPSGSSNHFVPSSSDNAGCNRMLPVDCVIIGSSGSIGDRESQSKIDSIPADRTPLEITISSEASAAKLETTGPPASQKLESIVQPPVKKCRLIVKVDSGAYPSSNEDNTTANSVTFPETMTSKLCPVCKTFTSSSNTTLNAHIDQCLFSVKSIFMGADDCRLIKADCGVIKHGIKSRKTRSIVDIYAAAPQCTLEELHRKNGTRWAMGSSLDRYRRKWMHPFLKSCSFTRENVVCAEEEKQGVSAVNFKEKGDEGAVYIDSNGKKIRILSKFNDTSAVPKLEADPKGGRGSKSHHAQKQQKYLKLAPQSKKKFSSKPRHTSQVRGDQQRSFALEERCRKEKSLTQPFKALEQIKLNDSGTMAKWVCSKRTGLLKMRNSKKGLQQVGYNFPQEFPVESDQSSLGVSYMERSCVQKMPNSYESPLSSPESSKRVENSSFEAPSSECNEQPPVRKTVGFTSLGYQIGGDMERVLEPPKCNVKQLRKDSTSVDGSCKNFAIYGENYVPSLGKEPVEVNAGPVKNSSHDVCSNLSRKHRASSSKATKFSSLTKQMLCLPESKYKVNGKGSFRKKSGLRSTAELDEEVVALPSVGIEKHDSKEMHAENQSETDEIAGKVSLDRCSVLQIRKKRGAFSISQDRESMTLKSASECHNHEVGKDIDSSARVRGNLRDTFDDIESGRKGIQTHRDDIETGLSVGVDFGGNVVNFRKSLDLKFHKLASPSSTLAGSLQSVVFKRSLCGAETPSCPNDPRLGDEQEIVFVDEVGNSMIGQNVDLGAEMDSKDGQGDYFTVVDPIPIPGPPGSFLPSPGDMGSEDLQGNSSLTTSRVQSYEDQHDQVDKDSSDSPISAMSTISNSTIARSDSKSSENFSVEHHVTQDEIRLGFSCASNDVVAENTATVSEAATIHAERISLEELKVNMMSAPEKGAISFRNDQPCCCSRKEGMSQGVSLNFQESQLLRRRTMASVPVPTMGKHLNCDPNRRPEGLNSMPEVISISNFPSSGSEKVVLPVTESAVGPVSVKLSADSALKSPIYGDCDFASPSASNPVLRLMGKNLMVVNQDENISQQLRPALNVHPNPQFQAISEVPPGNIQNEDFHSFHHMVHPQPPISGQNQCNTGFKVDLPNSFGNHVASKIPQTTSAGMFLSKNVGGGFTASLELQKNNVRYSLPNEQNRSRNQPYTPLAYSMEKLATNSDTQHRNADSTTDPTKEIIIIDDTPEREADSATDAPYSEGMRESRVSSAGIFIPMAANYNSRHVNPFYSYQPQPPSSLKASSSSTGRLRSSLYYSPGFS